MSINVLTRRGVVLLALLLGACAVQPPRVPPAPEAVWLAHRSSLQQLQTWQVQGRVAVKLGDEGWTAHFDWRQQGEDYRIRLRGPFGQGAVQLDGHPQRGVWLRRADAPPVFALQPETLLERETGWQLPVSGLSDWLRGLPVAQPGQELVWDEQGRLVSLAEDGWQIDYRRYRAQAGLELPALLVLTRGELRVKFVIDDWQLS